MSDRDTKGAEGDLHMARTYLKERTDTISTDVPRKNILLAKATEYVALAKRKDPDAKINVGYTITVDDLAADVHMAHFTEFKRQAGYSVKKRPLLLKAKEHALIGFSLGTSKWAYGMSYCDVLLDLHDKQGAVEFATTMCQEYPDLSERFGRDCRQNLDRIEAAPQTHEPTFLENYPGTLEVISYILAFVVFVSSIVMAANYGASYLWLTVASVAFVGIYSKIKADAYISHKIGKNLAEDVTRYQRTGKW